MSEESRDDRHMLEQHMSNFVKRLERAAAKLAEEIAGLRPLETEGLMRRLQTEDLPHKEQMELLEEIIKRKRAAQDIRLSFKLNAKKLLAQFLLHLRTVGKPVDMEAVIQRGGWVEELLERWAAEPVRSKPPL